MKRNELLRQIAALPAGADVGVQIGDEHLDVVAVGAWAGGRFGALRCQPSDLRDVLLSWGLPAKLRERLVSGHAGPAAGAE